MSRGQNMVAVVMPFHKHKMSWAEELSFRQNTKVLAKYPIYLILPEGTNASLFESIYSNIKLVYFSRKYFDTYKGSNQLWLHYDIYNYFREYKYILKCELDTYIFKDELDNWCDKDYDYVGAPWLKTEMVKPVLNTALHSKNLILKKIKYCLSYKNRKKTIYVGNGGLSLRKVSSFRLISRVLPFVIPQINNYEAQEDQIWSLYAASYFPFFSIPDYREALKFSMETEPRVCYQLNDHQLPFGCHAWEKYDVAFWKNHIDLKV